MTARRTPLPVTPAERVEFGFARTRCGCANCSVSCRFVPGFLVPADLGRLLPDGGANWGRAMAWADTHLRASPGARVAVRTPTAVTVVAQIRTLVPARAADGAACHWLGADGACGVHAASPYGCAFFDAHTDPLEGERRSLAGLGAVLMAWDVGGLYPALWTRLSALGLVAPGPAESRARMRAATGTEYPKLVPRPPTGAP